MKTKKPSLTSTLFGLLIDLLIDFSLIGLGAALYYTLIAYPILPITLNPAFTNLVSNYPTAAYIICGIPFVVGILSLVRTISRTYHKIIGH